MSPQRTLERVGVSKIAIRVLECFEETNLASFRFKIHALPFLLFGGNLKVVSNSDIVKGRAA